MTDRPMPLRDRIMFAAARVAGSIGELLLLAALIGMSAWR